MKSIRMVIVGFALLCALSARGAESVTVDPVWQGSIEQDIAAQEYRVSTGSGGLLGAPNRAHGLRVTFDTDGVTVRPRIEDTGAFEWGLEFVGFGRGESITRPQATTPIANGNRVEYLRGNVVEWYVNDANGLEQGFTIAARPEGEGDLVVVLGMGGTLNSLERDGAIDFMTDAGVVALRYDKLLAFDANGKTLSATMHLEGGEIRIEVDDCGATYPITIDPLTTNPAWTAESNQSSAFFGISVATAGDVNGDGCSDVVAGAWAFDNGENNEGRAFVYLGSAAGLAGSPAWTAEGNQVGASFGRCVATAGDVNGDGFSDVFVGAPDFDNGLIDEGRAFVYLGSAAGPAAAPAWAAAGNQSSARFGFSVATASDVNGDGFSDVVVGAYFFNSGQSDEGRALVYLGSAAGLAAAPAWTAESNQQSAFFGHSVAPAGDVNGDGFSDVVVGAYSFDNGEADEGRVFVYHGSVAGLAATPAWIAEGNQIGATFGRSVATAGDVNGDGFSDVIVGADQFDNGETDEGGALVYHGAAVGLTASPAWTANSDQASAAFGSSVSSAGDVNGDGFSDVIVGAEKFDNGESNEGRAFVYLGSAAALATFPTWTAESDQASAEFGHSVSTAGDVNGDGFSDVIVGAYLFDNGETDEGRAFVYLGSPSGPAAIPGWTAESDQAAAYFGSSVASAGDVNGDGYSDVIVGAHRFGNGETYEGRAFVYLGSAGGLGASPAWTAESDQAAAEFGESVASAGDVNGDGYSDVVVGSRFFTNGETYEGRAFIYLGSAAGLAVSPAWTAEGNAANAWFGYSVAMAGDVNGDGYSDVVVGAPAFNNPQLAEGRSFVYLGSAAGLAASPAWTAESNQASAQFGYSVATAGDVNGDGYSDVVVGATGYSNGEPYEGLAFVYLGSAAGLAASPARTAECDQAGAAFGYCVATAGDVNGDSYSEVVVGARSFNNGNFAEGCAFVYLGSAAGLALTPAWTPEGNQTYAVFGTSVATAGDVNGDGCSDVVVGAPGFSSVQTYEGRAFVYLGSAAGVAATPVWTAEPNQASASFGESVANAGDVNGDGCSDIVVGAPNFTLGQAKEGRAFLYYGNEGPGVLARPRQRLVDDSAPVAILGRTTTGSYRASMNLRSSFGRGDARLAVESKPLGTPFDGTGLTQSSLVDAGTSGADTAVTINGLAANTKHHWRARVVHSKATTPFLPAGPWFSIPGNGAAETDIRAAVCGGTMASATPYGTGKAGTLGIPLLSSTIAPAKGSLSDVTISGGKPFASPVILFAGFAPAAIPFDGGVLRVNPTFTISMPPLNGAGSLSLPVQHSTNPSTCGLHIYFQAIFADPGAAGFYHTAQTNGLDWLLGS